MQFMQFRSIDEYREFASTLPPQFADMQSDRQPPNRPIMQPLAAIGLALEQATLKNAAVQQLNVREHIVQSLAMEHQGKSRSALEGFLGKDLGAKVADAIQSQAPTLKQILGKRQRMYREADAEFGKGLATLDIQVQHHSTSDYTHVIVTQLNRMQEGANPSVSEILRAAFPNDSKKATSIGNSQNSRRWKQAYTSPAVINYPMEKAMQAEHGKDSMNRRYSARTFGQSLGINRAMFKSCDRIAQLEARVQLLEQQMQSTKSREALADAGATSSRDKILALSIKGHGATDIAKLLDMKLPTVKKAIQRARKAG